MSNRGAIYLPYFEKRKFLYAAVFLFALALMGMAQDYAEAYFHNYSFYLSESLLFKSYWLFFIPSVFYIFSYNKVKSWPGHLGLSLLLSFIHLIIFAFALHMVSKIALPHTYELSWAIKKTFSEDFYKFFVVYLILVYMNSRVRTIAAGQIDTKEETLLIVNGRKSVQLAVAEIYYISADSPYLAIHTATEKFLYTSTLREILAKLDPEVFQQVHRSVIVNVGQVAALRSRLNGDYDLDMKNGQEVRMSRSYSKAFRSRFS